jgi:hypothetical protein
LHGVIYRHTRRYNAAWAIDVEEYILLWVFALKEKKLRDYQIRDHVIHFRAKEDDSLFQKAAIDIVRTLTASCLLNYEWKIRHDKNP